MGVLVNATSHGFVAGDLIVFNNLDGGEGIVEGKEYYVIATGLTANAFEFSTTLGGSAVVFATSIVSGEVAKAPTYSQVADGVMNAPTVPSAPGSVTLSSAVTVAPDGTAITRLDITIVQPTSATLRHTVVTVQASAGQPVEVIIPLGKTTGSVASVIPGETYNASAISYDTFGNASAATAASPHVAVGDTTAPATPTGHTVTGGILSAFISWSRNAETDLDHYIVFYSTDPALAGFRSIRVYSTSVTVANLSAGTWYFNVAAVDYSDNQSGSTTIISATVRAATGSGTGGTDVATGSIAAADIKANTITASQIAANTITASQIAADTITANEIAASAITSSELATGAVVAGKIAAGVITANEIAAQTITAGRMAQSGNNEAPNGSFEYKVSTALAVNTFGPIQFLGWTIDNALASAWSTTLPHGGGICSLVKATSAAPVNLTTEAMTVIAARKYRLSYWYRGNGGNNAAASLRAFLLETDQSGTVTTTNLTVHVVGVSTTWVQGTETITLAATTVTAQIRFRNDGIASGDIVGFDDVEWYPTDYDINHAGGNVVIDATGITITNGKLTLQDEFGSTALQASGFSGTWLTFLTYGLYNASFAAGSAGAIADGRTSALPFWTVSRTGSPVLTRVADATYPGAFRLDCTFAALSDTLTLTSDKVDTVSGYVGALSIGLAAARTAGSLSTTVNIDQYSSADVLLSTLGPLAYITSATVAFARRDFGQVGFDPNVRYVKVRITFGEVTTHNAANKISLGFAQLTKAIRAIEIDGSGATNIAALTTANITTLTVLGTLNLGAGISDTLSTNPANWSPTGVATAVIISANPNGAARSIHSLDASTRVAGDVVIIRNAATATAQTLTLVYESASASTATWKFRGPNATDVIIRAQGSVMLVYTGARWSIVAI